MHTHDSAPDMSTNLWLDMRMHIRIFVSLQPAGDLLYV